MVFEMDHSKPASADRAGGGAKPRTPAPAAAAAADPGGAIGQRDALMRLTASVHTNQANLVAMCAKETEE